MTEIEVVCLVMKLTGCDIAEACATLVGLGLFVNTPDRGHIFASKLRKA